MLQYSTNIYICKLYNSFLAEEVWVLDCYIIVLLPFKVTCIA